MEFPFQTWFWINRRILYIEMPFSYIKLFNWENIGYVAYPPETLFWSLKEDKYIHCGWMRSFVYLRNLATSDIPISGFPGWWTLVSLQTITDTTANRIDTDETARNEPSHLDLHCLPFCYWFLTETPIFNKRAKMALYRSPDYQINWPFGSGEEVQIRLPR